MLADGVLEAMETSADLGDELFIIADVNRNLPLIRVAKSQTIVWTEALVASSSVRRDKRALPRKVFRVKFEKLANAEAALVNSFAIFHFFGGRATMRAPCWGSAPLRQRAQRRAAESSAAPAWRTVLR